MTHEIIPLFHAKHTGLPQGFGRRRKLKFAQAQKEYLKQKEILEGVERKLDDAFSARIKKKYRI